MIDHALICRRIVGSRLFILLGCVVVLCSVATGARAQSLDREYRISSVRSGGPDSLRADSLRADRLRTDSLRVADTLRTVAPIAAPIYAGKDRRLMPGYFDLVTNLPSDWRDWSVNAFRWQNWPWAAAIAASTTAMVVYDNQMWVPFKKLYETNQTWQKGSDMFVFMGDGKFQFGLAGVFAGYGVIAGDKRALRTAEQTCEVILACGGVVQLLKHLTGRESPIVSTTPTGRWQLFPNQIEYAKHVPHYDAFPSGHLSTALATLTVIANNYPEQKWIWPVGIVALGGITVGLVSTSIHWWSDFPLAVALGYTFGNLISPDPSKDVSVIEPQPGGKNLGEAEPAASHSFYSQLVQHSMLYPTIAPDGGAGVGLLVRF